MKNSLKRQYIKLLIWLSLLILMIFCVVIGTVTYLKADGIRTEYTREICDNLGFITQLRQADEYEENAYDDIESKVYEALYKINRYSDVGFYSVLKDSKGNTVAEDQYFMIIAKYEDEEDRRILLLGDEFVTDNENSQIVFSALDKVMIVIPSAEKNGIESNNYSEVIIKGTCDDTYVYPEEVKWKIKNGETFSFIPEVENTMSGTMNFEEWLSDEPYLIYNNSVSATYGEWDKCEKLNEEAKEICEQIYHDFYHGVDTLDDQSKDGLLTCYVAGTGYLNDEYAMPYVYVFHPVNIAISELTGMYAGIIFFGCIVFVVLAAIIYMTYKKQLEFEMNRRELTRGIAHELKTPLAITKGYIENWKYMDEEGKDEYNEVISNEIDNMNALVMDLLELSRLEAKAKEMHPEEVDLISLTRSILGRMKVMADERKLDITVEPDEGELVVKADLEMMRTVILNLVSNAVKYAESQIKITMSQNGKKVCFNIENDGQTLEKEKLSKVWDEFYRDGDKSNHRSGSSGLGLAIAKNILILHKATYGCNSKEGKTRFWFEIK